MNIQTPANRNYAAVVVEIDKLVDLDNCDNVKAALIFGNSVIVSKDTQLGSKGLFFPVESALSKEFLSANNLYRENTWNADTTKKGFFEPTGRVKAVKFRGHKSEGFWVPVSYLESITASYNSIPVGTELDTINGVEICRKYVPVGQGGDGTQKSGKPRTARLEDRIVDGQFTFHVDTDNLRRNIDRISPDDVISISEKWHGTSAVFANLLINKPLKWYQRLAKVVGVQIEGDVYYGLIWSSRRVVKGVDGEAKAGSIHYYSRKLG